MMIQLHMIFSWCMVYLERPEVLLTVSDSVHIFQPRFLQQVDVHPQVEYLHPALMGNNAQEAREVMTFIVYASFDQQKYSKH